MIHQEDLHCADPCWKTPGNLKLIPMEFPVNCSLYPKYKNDNTNQIIPSGMVYISGPVTGIDDLNKPQFLLAERLLLSVGCSVFNPTHIPFPGKGMSEQHLWQYYMHFCVRALPLCEAIFMLPHWQNSKGACWERRIAEMLGLDIYYAPVLGS